MIEKIITNMYKLVNDLQETIILDIEDVKQAKHEELLTRNDIKQSLIDDIINLKAQLNQELVKSIENGIDVNIYRDKVNYLEEELKKLYELNKKLASIVLPVQKMYKDIVDEITIVNGGSLINVQA